MTFPVTPKNLISLSAALLMLAVVFGALNTQKVKSLQTSAFNAVTLIDNSERRHSAQERESKAREASLVAKVSEMEGKTAKAESELEKIQADKANLQSKLQANEDQITALHRQIDGANAKPSANPGAPSTIELQAQLEETRTQLEAAKHEKMLLSDKIHGAQERSSQFEDEKKQRDTSAKKTGIRGTILAVNQAYNFVVLSLGGRQGVELNAEMLVIRNGTLIGKIRVSSVEPSTAIGDILPAAWRVASKCNLGILSFMLATHNLRKTIARALLFVAAVSLVSCATHKDTVFIKDPNNKPDSTIPWNKQEQWESSEGQLQNVSDRR